MHRHTKTQNDCHWVRVGSDYIFRHKAEYANMFNMDTPERNKISTGWGFVAFQFSNQAAIPARYKH